MAAAVRRELSSLDKDLAISGVRPMSTVVAGALRARRVTTSALTAFGVAALILATLGLYGVVALSVADRTREMGVRAPLGATAADLRRLVIGQGVRLALAGVAIGVPAALATTRLIRDVLFEVHPQDPVVFAGVAVVWMLVSLAACDRPARRASRIEPAAAVRTD